MYPLGTWFVSEICVWLPCIKETMITIIIIIIIITVRSFGNDVTNGVKADMSSIYLLR